jgi:hypothetical protein
MNTTRIQNMPFVISKPVDVAQRRLLSMGLNGLRIERPSEAGMGWAVWTSDDIIGSGATLKAAMLDAIKTAEGWNQ